MKVPADKTAFTLITHTFCAAVASGFLLATPAFGQQKPDDCILASKEQILFYTAEWKGERLPDGRPRIPDSLLERLKKLRVEDVWQLLNQLGYRNQFEGGWQIIHEDRPLAGRALTALYMPLRPDVQQRIAAQGKDAGHVGPMNSWPIDQLQNGDIYVADAFGKIAQGTLIGDKLGNSIFARSGNGVVFDGAIRKVESLAKIDGFNAFVRGWHPSFLEETMLMGINVPIRIGSVAVMPGDVVFGRKVGVVFIPAHLVERVVITAEIVELRDEFVFERVRARVYTPGQVDTRWTEAIEKDFLGWLTQGNRAARLPVPIERMQDFLRERTW